MVDLTKDPMLRATKENMYNNPSYSNISTFSNSNYALMLFVTSLFITQISSTPLKNVAPRSNFTSAYGDQERIFNIRLVAALCSTLSMFATYTTFYWFGRMEKRFRHRLIMLLIYGDLVKATWIFIFAVVSITQGTVRTESAFCQISGFLIQYSTETSDYAVLVIALHAAFQVFRPSGSTSSEGLYPYRHYVILGAIFIPTIMASLAFINSPRWGYMSQGAFCTLPLRPFWYRLALSWIPRYLIAAIILSLAIAIYTHVGFQLRHIADVSDSIKPPSPLTATPVLSDEQLTIGDSGGNLPAQPQHNKDTRRASSVTFDSTALRRASAVASLLDSLGSNTISAEESRRSRSLPTSFVNLHTKRSSAIFSSPSHNQARGAAQAGNPDSYPQTPLSPSAAAASDHPYIQNASNNASRNASPISGSPNAHSQRHLRRERARIYRQLRLMFVYPLVYTAMWVIPFALHCMMYTDKWAARPVYWLTIMATICQSLLGFVDCLVFSLRERPWRHIPNTDGTFIGSFWPCSVAGDEDLFYYRRTRASTGTMDTSMGSFNPYSSHGSTDQMNSLPNIQRVRRSVRTSASSDNAKVTAEMARVRLEMEKEDRRREFQKRREDGDVAKKDTAAPTDMLFGLGDEIEQSESQSDVEDLLGIDKDGNGRGRSFERKTEKSNAQSSVVGETEEEKGDFDDMRPVEGG